jgi:hypothetical protein
LAGDVRGGCADQWGRGCSHGMVSKAHPYLVGCVKRCLSCVVWPRCNAGRFHLPGNRDKVLRVREAGGDSIVYAGRGVSWAASAACPSLSTSLAHLVRIRGLAHADLQSCQSRWPEAVLCA